MQADMRVLRLGAPSEIWLDTEPEALAAALRHLQMYTIGREVEVDDRQRRARDPLADRPAAAPSSPAAPPLPEHACEAVTVGGVECLAVGTDVGIDLIAAAAEAERAARGALAAGAAEVGPEAAEILRIEAGVPRFGAEMGDRDDARRGRASSSAPSASPRAATSARRRSPASTTRASRTATCAACASAPRPRPATPLRLGEKEVGRLGSACVSPALGPIALAILRREAEPGAELDRR